MSHRCVPKSLEVLRVVQLCQYGLQFYTEQQWYEENLSELSVQV